jgi:hypothetical protein
MGFRCNDNSFQLGKVDQLRPFEMTSVWKLEALLGLGEACIHETVAKTAAYFVRRISLFDYR